MTIPNPEPITQYVINITQDHINQAIRRSAKFCPIARAIRTSLSQSLNLTRIYVADKYISLTCATEPYDIMLRNHASVTDFILTFDANPTYVDPDTIILDLTTHRAYMLIACEKIT